MKKKLFFEEPELEVVRFDPKDTIITASGDPEDEVLDCEEETCLEDDF